MTKALDLKKEDRLKHIVSCLEGDYSRGEPESTINILLSGKGSNENCLYYISNHHRYKAIHGWVHEKDINQFKQHCYVAGKLMRMEYQIRQHSYSFTHGPGYHVFTYLFALLSDNIELINWFKNFEQRFNQTFKNNPKKLDYLAYNYILALKGEWKELEERCIKILAAPPSGMSKAQDFQRFLLALAQGNIQEMQAQLEIMVSPKMIHARSSSESGLMDGLISSYAVFHAKIAWLHGYEVKIDSRYLPLEWLPVKPLEKYIDPYPFMQDFDINTPLDKELKFTAPKTTSRWAWLKLGSKSD